jgi:hypothetical protein
MKSAFFSFLSLVVVFCTVSASAEGPAAASAAPSAVSSVSPAPATLVPAAPAVLMPSGSNVTAGGTSGATAAQQGAPGGQPQEGQPKADSLKAPAGDQAPAEAGDASAVERAFSDAQQSAEKSQPQVFSVGKITQFGYNFFRPEAAGFASLVDVPVGPDYILGAGDRLLLTLWGSVEGTYELEINRAGEIVLPKVGALKVAGQTYGQLPGLLKSHLGRVYKDFQLNLNMGKLRLVKVYVVGQVKAPGTTPSVPSARC